MRKAEAKPYCLDCRFSIRQGATWLSPHRLPFSLRPYRITPCNIASWSNAESHLSYTGGGSPFRRLDLCFELSPEGCLVGRACGVQPAACSHDTGPGVLSPSQFVESFCSVGSMHDGLFSNHAYVIYCSLVARSPG